MKAEELLKPRFEVIADYPFNPYKIGEIAKDSNYDSILQTKTIYTNEFGETVEQSNFCNAESFEKYPALFRKINWWEKRNKEDMPKKVMSLANDKKNVFDIEDWDMEKLIGWINKEEKSICSLRIFKPEYGYIPVD